MNSVYFKIKSFSIISKEEVYPGTSNSPTYITKYRCPCGKGEIVEENTVGFNDHFVVLKCPECLKKYRSYVDIVGYDFRFYSED